MKVEGIVLAGGLGTRMGGSKPLVEVGGVPTLARVIGTLRKAGLRTVVVVLGSGAKAIRDRVDLSSCRVVVNRDFASGLSSSVRAGIAALSPGADGALLVHADLPLLSSETVRAVLGRAEAGTTLARATYRGAPGFPVYLHRSVFPELLASLRGDEGAREYLAAHAPAVARVEVDDPGATRDVDRPEDLQTLVAGREETE